MPQPVRRILPEVTAVDVPLVKMFRRDEATGGTLEPNLTPHRLRGSTWTSVEAHRRLALLLDCISEGFWEWNTETDRVYIAPSAERMLGYAEQELPQGFADWQRLFHPVDLPDVLSWLETYRSLAGPRYKQLECRIRRKDGNYCRVLMRGAVVRNRQGKVIRMAGSLVDVTARKAAIAQLLTAYAELARKEHACQACLADLKDKSQELQATRLELVEAARLEAVGMLAAGVAHEVKNPLQILVMGLGLLKAEMPAGDEKLEQVFHSMQQALARANSFLRELLDLAAARSFDLVAGDLNGLIERTLNLIHGELLASRTTVVRRFGAGLPLVKMDASKMEQVFINLFLNAIQAMGHGGVLTISTRTARVGQDMDLIQAASRFTEGELVVIAELQDTGPGISDPKKIFHTFFTTKPGGTGLGLSVVKQIVDSHQGLIEITNAPQGGALARLVLRSEARPGL